MRQYQFAHVHSTAVGRSALKLRSRIWRHRFSSIISRATTRPSSRTFVDITPSWATKQLKDYDKVSDDCCWWRPDEEAQLTSWRDPVKFQVNVELYKIGHENGFYIVEDGENDSLEEFFDGIEESLDENKSSKLLLCRGPVCDNDPTWIEITPSGVLLQGLEETILSPEGMESLMEDRFVIERFSWKMMIVNAVMAEEYCSNDFVVDGGPGLGSGNDNENATMEETKYKQTCCDLMQRFGFDKDLLGRTQEEYDLWLCEIGFRDEE